MTPEVVPQASVDQEVEYFFSKLFHDVVLNRQQRAAAEEIIRRDVSERRVRHRGPEDAWTRGMALMARRDDALRSILTDPVQQAAFAANAAELRRQWDDLRRSAGQ